MRGGPTAPGIGVVHQVVVHERSGVKELKCCSDPDNAVHLLGVDVFEWVSCTRPEGGPGPNRVPTPVCKQCAKAFAASGGLGCDRGEVGEFGGDPGEFVAPRSKFLVESRLHEVHETQTLSHAPSLASASAPTMGPGVGRRAVSVAEEGARMPLSDREQRLLDEMERNLYHADADYVATVGGGHVRSSVRAIALGIALGVLGLGLLVVGVMLQQPIVGILGFVGMFGGALLALAPPRGLSRSASVPMGESAASPDDERD